MSKVSQGDYINGEKIAGQALKILPINRSGHPHRTKLERDAYCVVEIPLKKTGSKSKTQHRTALVAPEELEAHKIAAQADWISEPKLFPRSGTHRGQRITMNDSAFCIIEIPMRWVNQQK